MLIMANMLCELSFFSVLKISIAISERNCHVILRTERSMVTAICGVHHKDNRGSKLVALSLNKTIG